MRGGAAEGGGARPRERGRGGGEGSAARGQRRGRGRRRSEAWRALMAEAVAVAEEAASPARWEARALLPLRFPPSFFCFSLLWARGSCISWTREVALSRASERAPDGGGEATRVSESRRGRDSGGLVGRIHRGPLVWRRGRWGRTAGVERRLDSARRWVCSVGGAVRRMGGFGLGWVWSWDPQCAKALRLKQGTGCSSTRARERERERERRKG